MPALGLAANRMNSLTVSAPNLSIISSGDTVLPRLLLIFALLSLSSESQWGQFSPEYLTFNVMAQLSHHGAVLFTIP